MNPDPSSLISHPSSSPRVLVIGLDGGSYDVLMPLAKQGLMPNLARLMASSALAELTSTDPYITPTAWTTFQTGCDPQTHGIWDYRYLDHRQGQVLLNHAGRIPVSTLFSEVSAAGGQVVSLNLPMTHPVQPGVNGLIVGGLDSPSTASVLEPYPEFARRLRESGARFDIDTIWQRRPATLEELRAGVRQTQADFRGRVTAAETADEMTGWQLMVVQFQTLDALQHRCWHLLGIDDACTAPACWTAEVHQALRVLDDCIGRLMELATRRSAAVAVVSDHGFGPFRERISLPELLRQRGLLATAALTSHVRHQASRIGLNARKWLSRRLHPGASTAALERSPEALLAVDWRRTTAVALHGDLAGLIYLNTPERFSGPVATPRQRDQATADVLAAFREARHPDTGEALFEDACATAERFGCDPLERMWPDVIAIPAPGFHTRTKLDRVPRLVRPNNALTGTHRRAGVLMLQAPSVTVGERHTAHLRDVAPTILRLLGLPLGSSMTGCPLAEMVPRCEMIHMPGQQIPPSLAAACVHEPNQQATIEARLRALGYLD